MATKSSFYSNTGTTTNNIASITSLNNEATASKDAAAVSATNAATSATASEVSNVAALVSKNAAATSETTASTHKDTATTQAALATTNGAAQVTLATAQVALATTQAGLATTNGAAQVTLATAQVALGTTQAGNSATSAAAAVSSQNSATSSASTATTKASEAAASAASAAASLDLFTDQYLGSKSSAPTVDNDGDALTSGDLYYDSTASELRYYNGSAWVTAYIAAASMASLSGATFTGNVTVPNLITAGNVDGRDVSVDGTKLDAVAASANNYVHPNHSGDVVSTADGATVIQVDAVDIAMLSATGAASATTFLRGDNTWVTPTDTDTNTTYSVGDGGLSEINFTSADNTKLDGVAASANNYVHPNHSGDVVSTADGATVIQVDAVDIAMLSATGTAGAGNFLRGDNTWSAVDGLPAQTGNAGKFLTTNASAASWAVLDTDANSTTKGLYEMANVISANYVIGTNNNAISAGPITINSSISVTIPSGSTWVIA
jgi:hypothetical protein